MSNNIFWNFSWGNNIPKIFTLFISLSVLGGGGGVIYVCKFTIISILLFWVSCIPKSINYLGGVCVIVLVKV